MNGPVEPVAWSFQVRDHRGRAGRDLSVQVRDREIVLATPPPGTVRLTAADVTRLMAILSAARDKLDLDTL